MTSTIVSDSRAWQRKNLMIQKPISLYFLQHGGYFCHLQLDTPILRCKYLFLSDGPVEVTEQTQKVLVVYVIWISPIHILTSKTMVLEITSWEEYDTNYFSSNY